MAGFFRGGGSANIQSDVSRLYGEAPQTHSQGRPVPAAPSPVQRVPVNRAAYTPRVPARAPVPQAPPHAGAGTPMAAAAPGGARVYRVTKAPAALNTTNCVILNPGDWPEAPRYVAVDRRFVFTALLDTTGTVPRGAVGTALLQRQWAALSADSQDVVVEAYSPAVLGAASVLGSVDIEVDFLSRGNAIAEMFRADEMAGIFACAFAGHAMSIGQILVFEFHGQNLRATVVGIGAADGSTTHTTGIFDAKTSVNFSTGPGSLLQLQASRSQARANAILRPNFRFEDMGIGGLDSEFSAIFRRAFASRIFPPELVDKLGIQHVKGILLYGPPGTGKTLMARQIGKMLNAREPKIVNGPEVLSKFVGQSEENVRKLFAEAEAEFKAKGDDSGLHIIIFDELDAICRQRGTTGGGTGVGDSVVNQLLSKMDGVDQLNNILIIGMTNRMDMIDEALLRPGRLEVHMEINLPDESGRLQILNIQTAKMRTNGIMDVDVSLDELAALTKNFSGAEIAGLVKSATSFAFNRHVKVGTMAGISEDVSGMRVNRSDFMSALDEVRPAFGVAEEELQQSVGNGIMRFAPHIDVILRDAQLRVEQVRTSKRTPLVSVLLHGPAGSGKTALAATMAMASGFPFVKLISPENMVGMAESAKIAHINKVFNDSYRSTLSCIVVDSIEKLIEWSPIGPRFSNPVFQALSVLFGKQPPHERRLLVIATTSNRLMLEDMGMVDAFAADVRVPAVSSLRSIEHVVREAQLFATAEEHARAMKLLEAAGLGQPGRVQIGIKKLLSEIEMARLDDDPADKLTAALNV
ncbi:vesicle-fusing ATPase [Malassezia cuniculi]|uniref:Vesicular-fusion protein SEC18 n=1 Tax=Malassezia cuniculi TaxID=948313 RepID=A0AAF0EMW4_9BASI|nr:vesicle-fusing ATPase [Malassezia cuniculi]